MAEYPYTTVVGKIKPLLSKITQVGIPPRVSGSWLKSIGFTSSNDPSLVGVLKAIDFVDSSNVPTEIWQQYRGASGPKILGAAIRKGYVDLYAIYPDAHLHPRNELESVFSTSSKAGKQVIAKLVSTFLTLCESAEFSPVPKQTEDRIEVGVAHETAAEVRTSHAKATLGSGPSLHIDIQIHISPEADPTQIEQIFASMAKHLYPTETA